MNTNKDMLDPSANWTRIAQDILHIEAEAIFKASERLNGSFTKAVELILSHQGKVISSGIGKSGHVGRKISATLCSTGTPSVFLHPSEAVHGDLGIYSPGDPTILISKNGTTAELLRLVPILRQFNSPLIGIIGNKLSPLAEQVDIMLDASVQSEADLNNLAPTSSSMVAMALGDALAITLMQARNFTPEDFARYHPGGQLGRNLHLLVQHVMHTGDSVAWIHPESPLKNVVIEMTRNPLGAACVVDDNGYLVGLITDGDLRRALLSHDDFRLLRASDVMTHNPTTISPDARLSEALETMENRPSQISVLPVVSSDQCCLGLLRIHDIYST